MGVYNVGELIKALRKQKGISQEDLADGITDRANLSKIENGTVTPTKKVAEGLLERLGFSTRDKLNTYIGCEISKVQQHLDELDAHLKNQRTGEACLLISKLESDRNFKEGLYLQHLLAAKAANAINKDEDPAKVQAFLDEAIKISIPVFNERYIGDYLLTRDDFRILNMMAIVFLNTGELERAIRMMYGLKESIEKHCVDVVFKGSLYPGVIFNLANYLERAKRYSEAVPLCDAGIRCCLDTDFLRYIPLITAIKVRCLYEMKDIESCGRLIRQAYYGFDMFGMYTDKEVARKYAKLKLGIDL